VVLVALPLLFAALSIPGAIAANRERVRVDRRIRDAWQAIPYERAIVLWNDDHVHRLALFQALEHDHPQRTVEDPVLVSWPAERAAFRRAAGFDPLQGLDLRTPADLARIAPNIERRAPLPVVEFGEMLESCRAGLELPLGR
jgi:hypothetical protein